MSRLILTTFTLLFVVTQTSTQTILANEVLPGEIPGPQNSTDPSASSSGKQHRCEAFSQYQQKKCCYRADKIRDLQAKEFAIAAKNDKNLFELQEKYDQTLADLKIREGILELQDDYLKFMGRLNNPSKEDAGLNKLNSLKRLEADSKEVIDRAYRMQFLHEAMEEFRDDSGIFTDKNGDLVSAENLYQQASQQCQESKKTEGLCSLLNPESKFNQNSDAAQKIQPHEIKEMMKNFLMSYGVGAENLSKAELFERNAEYTQSLDKIPSSVLQAQIESYENSQKELKQLFSQNENDRLKHIYNCIKKTRYNADDNNCKQSMKEGEGVLEVVESISQRVLNQAKSIVEQADFSEALNSRQVETINNSLHARVGTELGEMKKSKDKQSLTQKEENSFQEVLNLVENKLKLALKISNKRAGKTDSSQPQDDLLSRLNRKPKDLDEFKSVLMRRLCNKETRYSSSKMLECLEGTDEQDKLLTLDKINKAKKTLKDTQAQIDEIISSDKFQRINSFKNYYAYRTQNECSSQEDDSNFIKTTGQCFQDYGSSLPPVTKLVDSTQNVIAEIQFNQRGGPERSIEELARIHEFCYGLEEQERQKYEHECKMASKNYIEATKDYTELSPDTKEYISENMAVADPQTGEISYEKRRSTWGMVGINSARAVASSIPTIMNYQNTKMSLPFMADQAKFHKTLQYWQEQQFTANFFRPGAGLNPFGMPGGLSYGISPFNSPSNFGSRVPIGAPQGFIIP